MSGAPHHFGTHSSRRVAAEKRVLTRCEKNRELYISKEKTIFFSSLNLLTSAAAAEMTAEFQSFWKSIRDG